MQQSLAQNEQSHPIDVNNECQREKLFTLENNKISQFIEMIIIIIIITQIL